MFDSLAAGWLAAMMNARTGVIAVLAAGAGFTSTVGKFGWSISASTNSAASIAVRLLPRRRALNIKRVIRFARSIRASRAAE